MSSKLRKKSRSRYNAETPNDWIIERVTVEICVISDQTLVSRLSGEAFFPRDLTFDSTMLHILVPGFPLICSFRNNGLATDSLLVLLLALLFKHSLELDSSILWG